MKKSRYYSNTKFPANVIAEAHQLFLSKVARRNSDRGPSTLRVSTRDESWEFDSVEEFLAEYAIADGYTFDHIAKDGRLWISSEWPKSSLVSVTFPSRPPIEAVFQVFEKNLDKSALPESAIVTTTPLKIFIGHGRDPQWRDLKDHLHEKQGLDVVAYEI